MSSIAMKASTSVSSVRPVVRHQTKSVVCRSSGTDGFKSAGNDLRKAANKAGDQLADNIDSAQRKAGNAVEDAKADVKAEAKSVPRDSKGAAKATAHDAQGAIDRGIDNVNRGVDNLKDGIDHVQDSAAAVGDQLKAAGKFVGDKVQEGVDASRKNINDAAHQ